MNIKKDDKKYIANTYKRFDLELVKGKNDLYMMLWVKNTLIWEVE